MSRLKSHHRTIFRIIFSISLSTVLIGAFIFYSYQLFFANYTYAEEMIMGESQRLKDPNVRKISLNVKSDTSLENIADALLKNNIISDKLYFMLEAKLEGTDANFIPGEYTISSNMSSTKILDLLTTPIQDNHDTIKFTVPEGYTIEQIAELLERKDILDKDEFLDAITHRNYAADYAFLKEIPNNPDYKYKLEGYLFPDTYIVHKKASPEEIIVKMLDRFDEIYTQYSSFAHSTGYTTHELLTIASIIEQEACLAEERPTISGVIYNRLEASMRLQMCSTVQYCLNKRKSRLTYEDLSSDNPYNTYLYSDLPIGPICNPGEACIKAALFPEDHDYFFFVLKNSKTGSHSFSHSMEQHNAAKTRYKQTDDINFTE